VTVSEDQERLGAPASVHEVRHDRVVRLVAQPARNRSCERVRHAIIRSPELREDWSCCYLDQVVFVIGKEEGGR
jgi:hypothetical protein